jgi:hypothetical protein
MRECVERIDMIWYDWYDEPVENPKMDQMLYESNEYILHCMASLYSILL